MIHTHKVLNSNWLILCAIAVLGACHPSADFVWAKDIPAAPAPSVLTLRPTDHVYVVVFGQDTMSGDFEVRPAGEVVLPVVGPIAAAGLRPEQLADAIRGRMLGFLADPKVSVVLSARHSGITVLGEVRAPGRFDLIRPEGVLQALARAVGLSPFADSDAIYVVRQTPRPQRIRFRYSDLVNGDNRSINFELDDGDTVIVE